MAPEQNLVVLSEYPLQRDHVGYSLLYDLQELILSWNIPILDVAYRFPMQDNPRLYNRFRNPYRVADVSSTTAPGNQLLVICSTPHFLLTLASLGRDIHRFSRIAVYFVDSFDAVTLDGFGPRILKFVDLVFTGIEEIAEDLRNHHGFEQAHFLPFGIDALSHARIPNKNQVDVFGYGRINREYHRALQSAFGAPSSPYTYVHSTFETATINSMREHRQLQWKLMSASSINLCFEPSDTPRFLNRSPVLYRWFEAWAAGNLVVGTRPKCTSAPSLMGWEDSMVDVPTDPADGPDAIVQLLRDRERLQAIQRRNQIHALHRHDWRYRFARILNTMGAPLPEPLRLQLDTLQAHCEGEKLPPAIIA
ncbi:Glycosyl transferases group 1 [Microbulbifer donghaiensis]|uniref:Glycosyl transferases group 1 n=1 Tax=Microbulbifer donghaiensis TaxID=494016 RepID=A0A1M4U917_9GAMM|nr:glycosyltransferase [Microbulbifer donghaiensis]SHE53126.1 Glycosyl transferases group 1 [Microbulbifer donghaiensis]